MPVDRTRTLSLSSQIVNEDGRISDDAGKRNSATLHRVRIQRILLIAVFLPVVAFAQQDAPKVATLTDITHDLAAVPCKNKDRLEAVKKLFAEMGAGDADIAVEKIDGVENVLVTKKGKTAATIIVSAHYDKVSDGCGALDNWTGIVIIANLYRTYRTVDTDKTYIFAAFDQEEKGLIGSRKMARSIARDVRPTYCADINVDSFGFTLPQVMDNTTSEKLRNAAEGLANDLKMPFHHAPIVGASADSASFIAVGIPAITFHGMTATWQSYLHTSNDKLANVKPDSVLAGYSFVTRYIARIDQLPCDAFRK